MNSTEITFKYREKWKPEYQRNNKQSGVKNLRCFPYCRDEHRDHGFCGRAVSLTVGRKDINDSRELFVFAEFISATKFQEVSLLGSSLSVDEALSKVRSRKDPFQPWYRGEVVDTKEKCKSVNTQAGIDFEVNCQKTGWNYTWIANKHTCHIHHTLAIYVFARNGNMLECIGVHESPNFVVYCRRRPAKSDKSDPSKINNKNKNTKKNKKKTKDTKNQKNNIKTEASYENTEMFSRSLVKEEDMYNNATLEVKNTEFLASGEAFCASGEEIYASGEEIYASGQAIDVSGERVDSLLIPDPFEFMKEFEIHPNIKREQYAKPNAYQPPSHVSQPIKSFKSISKKRAADGAEYDEKYTQQQSGFMCAIQQPVPLRPLNFNAGLDFELPDEILPFFIYPRNKQDDQPEIRKSLWRICVALTILESHWRTFPELMNEQDHQHETERKLSEEEMLFEENNLSSTCQMDNVDNVHNVEDNGVLFRQRLASLPQEPAYETPEIKQCMLAVASVFGSEQYANTIFEVAEGSSTPLERQKQYVGTTLRFVDSQISPYGISLRAFLGLFDVVNLREDVKESALKRLRRVVNFCKNYDINEMEGETSYEATEVSDAKVFRRQQVVESHSVAKTETKVHIMPFNPSGIWHFDKDVLKSLSHIRCKYLKTSWVLRKLIRVMEKEIKVTILGGNELSVSTRRRLMQSFSFKYHVDGTKREYAEDKMNIPHSGQEAYVYRAFWNGCALVFETFFGKTMAKKIYRVWQPLSMDEHHLHNPEALKIIVGFEKRNEETGEYEKIYENSGFCYKREKFSTVMS